ncbi:hypothetical protein M2323_004035 [Rhodoblastus acidophilus]|uniref:hypothetical protein n=1 Tax=Rhodoblastus acidophilus TaxID=1074 RepID=UPI002224A84A|nr:hypothetical protein [Rhodoblastus acidophilus]MCW2286226.1 hypothetical protein [Rhodoblastus acidophilus]MCW2335091.1 hypothetical protein [Rhodoblastus acidophilus]
MTMKQIVARLKRIEYAQHAAGLDPETAVLFEPILAIVAFHFLADYGAPCDTAATGAPGQQKGQRDFSALSDTELTRQMLHGFAQDLEQLSVDAGGEPRNGRELNAWLKLPATREALGIVYDAIPDAFKEQERFPRQLRGAAIRSVQ